MSKLNILPDKYPSIFTKPDGSKFEYFECNDGWFEILDNLCNEISKLSGYYYVIQIKEKFGGLRFYIDAPLNLRINKNIRKKIFSLIEKAEEKSFTTCEDCGNPGKRIRTGLDDYGWIKTLCDQCAKIDKLNCILYSYKDKDGKRELRSILRDDPFKIKDYKKLHLENIDIEEIKNLKLDINIEYLYLLKNIDDMKNYILTKITSALYIKNND